MKSGYNNNKDFLKLALEIFTYQAANNKVYKEFLRRLSINTGKIERLDQIPFLPASFFRTHTVLSGEKIPQRVFESSGTSGLGKSKHHVAEVSIYEQSFLRGFEYFYGDIGKYCILALLPSCSETENSSLACMVDGLIKSTGHRYSGFYRNNYDGLVSKLAMLDKKGQKCILFGVSFALLDFAETRQIDSYKLQNTIVMETGGMKARRKEITRKELHKILCAAMGIKQIHSEYGMTELLSQAYSKDEGIFKCPPWMKVLARDVNDPLAMAGAGKSGGLNIIDFSNLYSCAFIATQDLGKVYEDGSFEVHGRFDNSEVRGCNLMVSE